MICIHCDESIYYSSSVEEYQHVDSGWTSCATSDTYAEPDARTEALMSLCISIMSWADGGSLENAHAAMRAYLLRATAGDVEFSYLYRTDSDNAIARDMRRACDRSFSMDEVELLGMNNDAVGKAALAYIALCLLGDQDLLVDFIHRNPTTLQQLNPNLYLGVNRA
jgi:hypothetical protein